MSVKKFFKYLATRIWFIISCVFAFLLLVVNIALAVPQLANLVAPVFGYTKSNVTGDVSTTQYYKKTTSSKEAAKEEGDVFNISLAEEGITMLKNKDNAFPISKTSKVSVFGKNSVNLVYGGSGSGAVNTAEAKTLFNSLEAVGMEVNPTLKAFYENDSKSGKGRPGNPTDLDSGAPVTLSTGETPYSSYTSEVKNSYGSYNDLALVVISRIGGEGFDLPLTSEDDSSRHYLELDPNEVELIKQVTTAGFKKVAIIVNSGNAIELGFTIKDYQGISADKIDGVFLMPGTGTRGVMALGEILVGDVNPSGHTVDTYAYDFMSIPSAKNFADNGKTNGDAFIKSDGKLAQYYFVDYEEDIYVGYRYYETRGKIEGEEWYKNNVAYPFGFGLSYTDFSYELVDEPTGQLNANEKFTVKVKVTNTGNKAGKAVVQLYGHAPYITNQIEKSEVALLTFGKTSLLETGKDETIELEVDPYLLASYDYKDKNSDGFKGYTLDSGDYVFSIRTDSHTVKDDFTLNLSEKVTFEKDPVTGTMVKNLYSDNTDEHLNSDYHLKTLMSRTSFDTTFPTTPTGDEYNLSNEEITVLTDRNPNNPNTYEMPDLTVPEEDADIKLYDLFETNEDGSTKLNKYGAPYVEYDNPKWESLLSRVPLDTAKAIMNSAAFHTPAVDEIDKPRTYETDGPVGFVNFMYDSEYYGTAAYCSQVLVGMTYNQELVTEWGEHVGEEGLWGDTKTNSPYSGWYAPGMNIHRSPFGGRNFEYYSEDPVHTGLMAAAEVKGARSKGVYCFAKHFALNEQETHRQSNGDISYVSEQAMREIYLKPFEILVKAGDCIGIMTSFNRIGLKWTGGDYRLLTTILRDEWGFRGAVIDDFNTPLYMPVKQMCYAGGDLNLSMTREWSKTDWNNANDVYVVRKALKNTLYTIVNSNAMNGHGSGIVYESGFPIFRILQIVIDIVIPVGIVVSGVIVIMSVKKKPDVE